MKNVLAIDTSTDVASVAIQVDGKVWSETQPGQKSHARLLLPMIDKLLQTAQVRLDDLDAIAFGAGPGSFTGLRIACAVAKGLAFAKELPVMPVSSLATIAQAARMQAPVEALPILAVLDARMQELYWGYFEAGQFLAKESVHAAQEIVVSNTTPFVLAGLGIAEYWPLFTPELQQQVSTQISCYPTAEAMLQLVSMGVVEAIQADKAEPVYVRNQVTQGEPRG